MTDPRFPSDLRAEIEALASKIAVGAAADNTPLSERLDALKVLTAWFAVLQKKKPDEDEPTGKDFGAFSRDVAGADTKEPKGDERAQVPGRRRLS